VIVWEVNVCLIVEFLRTQFSHVADETSMFFVSDDLHNCCRCCGRKQLDRQRKWVNTFYLFVINSVLCMQNNFWHKLRSFSVTGWMWHVSAVKSRSLPKKWASRNYGKLAKYPSGSVHFANPADVTKLQINSRMLVQQEQILHHVAWNTFYALIPWSVLLILWLWRFWEA